MTRSRVLIALTLVALAVVFQTTVFGASRIQPLGVAPALVSLVVILVAPYIEPEYHLLLGFTAGILLDLMGSGTLGVWAMALTSVAYGASRLRQRFVEGPLLVAAAVFGLTILGQVIFVVVSTLFGHNTIGEPQVVAKIIMPAVWNLVLTYPVAWLFRVVFRTKDRGWAI